MNRIPISAPNKTSVGVCPRSSRSFISVEVSFLYILSISLFSISACLPVARLSPVASYITTKLKKNVIAKSGESKPEVNPIEIVRVEAAEE